MYNLRKCNLIRIICNVILISSIIIFWILNEGGFVVEIGLIGAFIMMLEIIFHNFENNKIEDLFKRVKYIVFAFAYLSKVLITFILKGYEDLFNKTVIEHLFMFIVVCILYLVEYEYKKRINAVYKRYMIW